MKTVRLFALILVFLAAINMCSAYTIDSHISKYNIIGDNVVVQTVINFTNPETGEIRIPVPSDTSAVDLYLDGKKTESTLNGNELVFSLDNTDKIVTSYTTHELIDKTNFLADIPVIDSTNKLKIVISLPEGAVLKKSLDDVSGTVYPRPDKSGTDGKSLIFIWERNNLDKGDEFPVFVRYDPKESHIGIMVLLAVIILGLVAYIILSKTRKKQAEKKPIEITEVVKPAKEHKITEHLKEEEQQIVRVLKQRESSCEQGTLRVVTGFSKAHLSRLLSELEARKVVFKEKRGKKNLVFLKE